MKLRTRFAILPILVAVTFTLAGYPANASNDQSSVTKSKRTSHRVQSRTSVPDPSVGATCAYDRAAGRCMIDLGNGRCMECSSGPFK